MHEVMHQVVTYTYICTQNYSKSVLQPLLLQYTTHYLIYKEKKNLVSSFVLLAKLALGEQFLLKKKPSQLPREGLLYSNLYLSTYFFLCLSSSCGISCM